MAEPALGPAKRVPWEDLIDHDQLRHDPALAIPAGKLEARRADCAPLAGKTTLNGYDAAAIERLFVGLVLDAHRSPSRQIILDLHQEGRFFHGDYDCHCHLPLSIFCGRHLLAAKLRRSNIDDSAGAREEVERILRRICARWPRVRIRPGPVLRAAARRVRASTNRQGAVDCGAGGLVPPRLGQVW